MTMFARRLLLVLAVLIASTAGIAWASGEVTLMTWNVRGYPEGAAGARAWFSSTLAEYAPDVLCVQEIANSDRVTMFTTTERGYPHVAFSDSGDGKDNAIFFRDGVVFGDLTDPSGFQHPAQLAWFFSSGLFVADVLTVHLTEGDDAQRARERQALIAWASPKVSAGLGVIIAGDFNTKGGQGDTIEGLAQSIGMQVVRPSPNVGTTRAGNSYDFVLVSSSITSTWCATAKVIVPSDTSLANAVSDHYPVFVTFTPRTGTGCAGSAPTSSTCSYIGNKNTKVCHVASCSYLPDPKNRVCFQSVTDAKAHGYTPCGHCHPW